VEEEEEQYLYDAIKTEVSGHYARV